LHFEGCGNSELAFEISDHGYKRVINVDYAENVIEYMKSVTQEKERTLNKDYSGISWLTGDCLNDLGHYLPKDQYAIIIDKSLTDAIACGDDDQQSRVKKLSNEMLSVAKIGAYWFSISFSGEREFYCNNQKDTYWNTEKKIPIEVHQPNDKPGAPAIYYYLYISRKMEKQ
jgi:SAM-dependent methyltransferase